MNKRTAGRRIIPGLIFIIGTAICLCSCTPASTKNAQTDTTQTTASVLSPDITATAAPSPTPAAQYVFDLSAEPAKPEGNRLAMYLSSTFAVILSRDSAPYFITGDFNWTYPNLWSGTDTTEADWTRLWNEHQNTNETYYSGVTPVLYSMDNTSLAFLRNRTENDTFELMYYNGAKEIHVADLVSIYQISDDGSTIAYLTRINTTAAKGTLYTYDCSSGISTKIAENAGTCFTLSPTGKVIAYEASDDNGKQSYFAKNGGTPQLIGFGYSVVAITDDASTAYYLKYGGNNPEFGVLHNGSFRTYYEGAFADFQDYTGDAPEYSAQLIFNKDHSQVLYSNGDATCFAMNGGEAVQVFDTAYTQVVGYQNRYDDSDVYTRIAYCTQKMFCYSKFLESKNLCNVLFCLNWDSKTTIAFFDEKMETHTTANASYAEGIIARNGKGLLMDRYNEQTQSSGLLYYSDYLAPAADPVVLDKYLRSYEITSNQTIYFSNDVGQLFEIRDGIKTKIDTDASVIDSVDIQGVTYVYYFRDYDKNGNQTLCCVEDLPGAKSFVIDKDVCSTYTCSAGLLYYKNSVYFDAGAGAKDLYASSNGTDYVFVMTQDFIDR